ncbi:MAG: leucine-rich repeat protein [Clostridia bacterium]|nr:leucine-rich repeat protein [Clostridia bacterium]
MIKTKRILSIILVMLMLFSSLPLIVFAEETIIDETVYIDESEAYITNNSAAGADVVYEKGKTYTINGVDYFIEENGNVTVKGPALKGVPERIEILSKLGDYTVTSIGYGAFYNCKTVKEAVIPETVTLIDSLAFKKSGLTYIEIKGKNVDISTNFRDTPLWSDNIANDMNMLVVSGYAVDAFSRGEIVLGEDIVGISKDCFRYGSGAVTKITILNPDCHIFDADGALPPNAIVYGYKDSTAQQYALNHGYRFSTLCNCDDTVLIPASSSYCDGTVGYAEGYWCDNCRVYVSGGLIDTSFEHKDSDGDNICDLCENGTDTEILNAGKCGDEVVWTLSDDGILRITGTGSVYSYSATNREPWYNQRNEIKAFISDKGIELYGLTFREYQNLETAEMAEALSVPKSFRDCTALKSVKFPLYARIIHDDCFRNCTSLESVFIPKNIIEIDNYAFLNCTNLKDIDFETGYLSLQSDAFYGTAAYNNPDNIKDGFLYIDNCLIAEITPGTETLTIAEEITSIASGWEDYAYSKVTEIVVYNYNCAFPDDTGALPGGAHFKGYVGSTAWFYSKKDFVELEPHTHTEIIDIPAVAPTATEPGYTHVSHCAVCGETVTKRELVSPIEYNITVDEDTTTAQKLDTATGENDGADIIITFAVRHDVCTSNMKETVIYKVGEVKLSKNEFTYNGKVQKPTVIAKDSKGVTLVKDRDYKVTYSANSKYCGEYSVRVDYIGNYAGGKTLYYEIVIEAIFPTISSSTTESITLSWEQGHSDLVYRVYSVDRNGTLSKIDDTKNGSYEVSSLEAGAEYQFFVRAYVKDGNGKVYWGNEGDTISCATKADNTNNNMISFLKIFIERFKYILQILLMLK